MKQENDVTDSKIVRQRQLMKVAIGVIVLAIIVFTYDFVVDALNPPPVSKKIASFHQKYLR